MPVSVLPAQYPFPGLRIIDVRSEGEYERGHIPGAVNIPLLRNEERVMVGTTYKQQGREAAVAKGFELIGPRFAALYQQYREVCGNAEPLFYCWRGGLRSQISSTLMEWGGFRVHLLKGGYKGYRHHVQQSLDLPRRFILLGGMTGVGKTEILELLEQRGLPVLDLEALASHRGSVLGSLGMPAQPSVEMFENLLWARLNQLGEVPFIISENESRKIGTCVLPEGLWQQLLGAPVLEIRVPDDVRMGRLVREYAGFDPATLAEKTEKLRKRMGGLACQQAQEAILAGDKATWVKLLMQYYDRGYRYFMQENGYHADPADWDWSQTEKSLDLLLNRIKQYGTEG